MNICLTFIEFNVNIRLEGNIMKEVKLTKKQELVLNYIKEYTAKHGFPPAVREIAKGVGLNSPSSVHSHIKRLERDGFIKKTNSKFRTLEVVGINEYDVSKEEAVKITLYKDFSLSSSKDTFSYPADRIPKNEEIFALELKNGFNEFKKNDILIITKPKNYNKYDELVIVKDNSLDLYTVQTKNEVINKEYKIIGKLHELSRKY